MPCRSDGYPEEESVGPKARKQLDDLQAELCATQKLVLDLYKAQTPDPKNPFGSSLSKELSERFFKTLDAYAKHREKDKARALAKAKADLSKMESNIKTVKRLGGEAGSYLTNELKMLKSIVEKIEKSDPLTADYE
jgi:hypothetical protein